MKRRHERGFTLIECVCTVAILGVIILPLAAILQQQLTAAPASSFRTQTATDTSRLVQTFGDDVAQAQDMWTSDAMTARLQEPDDTAPIYGPALSNWQINCGDTTNYVVTFQTRDRTQDTGVAADGSVTHPAQSHVAAWSIVYGQPDTSGLRSVTLQRTPVGSTADPVLSAFCQTGSTIAEMSVTPPSASVKNLHVTVKLENLVDDNGDPVNLSSDTAGALTLDGAVRVRTS